MTLVNHSSNYSQWSLELFEKAAGDIVPRLLNSHINAIETDIRNIIEALDGRQENNGVTMQFKDWDITSLLSAYGRLSTLRVNLGELASDAQAKTNHIRFYKVFQNSKEWNPTKSRLEKEFDRLGQKMYKGDIEAVLIEAYWETTQSEVFQQQLADRLKSTFDSTNQVLSAIKMMVNHKTQEEQKARANGEVGQYERRA